MPHSPRSNMQHELCNQWFAGLGFANDAIMAAQRSARRKCRSLLHARQRRSLVELLGLPHYIRHGDR